MTVIKGTGFYHVEAANTNRQVFYNIAATPSAANLFGLLKGNNAFHPWIGQNAAPTVNQLIAQYRADFVARYLSQYAIIVYLGLAQTSNANDTLVLGFETYVSNVFGVGTGHTDGVGDIVDLLGMADRPAKTKPGLQTLATGLLTLASLDGGGTLLFAANPNLSDGTATTAPAITALTVTMQTASMYATTP